jgi:transcriptional regulator with XRE-family HTH domain
MNLGELARMSGVSANTISAIEHGVREPQAMTLLKLAMALRVDPATLMQEEEKTAV